ncbi:MAG: regulatory protein RecX [Acidobacteriota bacterium]
MKRKTAVPLDEAGLKEYALRLLAGRALTVAQLKEKLRRRAADAASVERVVAQLKEYGALDDRRFAESFSSSRATSGQFGSRRVLAELARRKVASKVAEQAVRKAFQDLDEDQLVRAWLERKYRNQDLGALLGEPAKLAGVYRRLRHAGFSSGAAIRVLRRFSEQAEHLEGMEPDAPAE